MTFRPRNSCKINEIFLLIFCFFSPSRFRIDNNDHVIDVNKGNLQFEYDQVHIICPYYEPGTNENETEKYIIYNVSKVEYETCRITNPNPRIIAICDKPFTTTLVTISFRPFTPQPGGLEFKPGNDYYFICKFKIKNFAFEFV
jgi:ephrin-B